MGCGESGVGGWGVISSGARQGNEATRREGRGRGSDHLFVFLFLFLSETARCKQRAPATKKHPCGAKAQFIIVSPQLSTGRVIYFMGFIVTLEPEHPFFGNISKYL